MLLWWHCPKVLHTFFFLIKRKYKEKGIFAKELMREKYGIRVEGLTVGFRNGSGGMRILYENASLAAPTGLLTAILGRNGTGKSSLLKSVAGLKTPAKGDIYIEGIPLKKLTAKSLAEKLAFVSTETVRIANLSARDVVAMGRSPYTGWTGSLSPWDEALVDEVMDLVGAGGLAGKSMDSLSDGERQRVMIARALAQDTPVIMLDEPTAFLDLPNRYSTALLLRDLAHEQGKTVLFTTHDMDIAMRVADLVCVIEGGAFHTGTPEEITRSGIIDAMFAGSGVSYDMYRNRP